MILRVDRPDTAMESGRGIRRAGRGIARSRSVLTRRLRPAGLSEAVVWVTGSLSPGARDPHRDVGIRRIAAGTWPGIAAGEPVLPGPLGLGCDDAGHGRGIRLRRRRYHRRIRALLHDRGALSRGCLTRTDTLTLPPSLCVDVAACGGAAGGAAGAVSGAFASAVESARGASEVVSVSTSASGSGLGTGSGPGAARGSGTGTVGNSGSGNIRNRHDWFRHGRNGRGLPVGSHCWPGGSQPDDNAYRDHS